VLIKLYQCYIKEVKYMARKIAQFKDTKVSGLKIYQFGI
jgi:hypothetical protein